jgi:hypothetical protein
MCTHAIVARQRLGKHVPAATNIRINRIIIWTRVSTGLSMYPLTLLGRDFVETLPRQGRIIGEALFYTVRVVSKESR